MSITEQQWVMETRTESETAPDLSWLFTDLTAQPGDGVKQKGHPGTPGTSPEVSSVLRPQALQGAGLPAV